MEAAVRSVQVGPPGQRNDTGPPQQNSTITYQQRVSTGASPIHRSVEQSSRPSPNQSQSRAAASPLSPPRPGPGTATTFQTFPGQQAREAPIRYVQPSSIYPTVPFRDNLYTRLPTQVTQQPPLPQIETYHRGGPQPPPTQSIVSSVPNSLSISVSAMETNSNRQRVSLLSHADYHTGRPPQAPPDPGGQQSVVTQSGPPAFKKIRLGSENNPNSNNINQSQQISTVPPPQVVQQQVTSQQHQNQLPNQQQQLTSSHVPPPLLKVDTREPPVSSGAYHPQVEAISPTLPADPVEEIRTAKDDLLQQITKVDHEIEKTERAIQMLKKKEQSLEEASAKPLVRAEELSESSQPKHRSLAQKIYAENRKKAATAHGILSALGPPIDLPLYNQPNDAEICRDVITRHHTFRARLLLHFRKIKLERMTRSISLSERYGQLSCDWRMRVEKIESSAKRKAKEAKNRELFEKVFPELRKQREDKERFNRVGARVKSEADMEEIMDNLHEQEVEEKKMRSYAVIPPLMLDQRQRRCIFVNENGALIDMETDFKERQNFNVWTSGEKEIFKEKFLQHPKNFGAIAASLDRKSAQDCVRYYYLSKKTENYKQLLRKSRQRTRSSRNPQKSNQNQTPCIVDAMTTGVTTRLQREKCEAQKTVRADRAAASANTSTSIVPSSTTSATSTNITNTTVTSTSSNSSTTSTDGVTGTKSPSISPPPGVINVSSTTSATSCSSISTSAASPMDTTPAPTSCSSNVTTNSSVTMPITSSSSNSIISTSSSSSDAITAPTILSNCGTNITTSSTSPLLSTSLSNTITTTLNSNSISSNDKNNESSSSNINSNTSKETATNLLCDISPSLSNNNSSNSSNINSNSSNNSNNNSNNICNLNSLSSSTIALSTATTTPAISIAAIPSSTTILTLPALTPVSTSILSTVTITATTTVMTGQIQTTLTSAPLLTTTSSSPNIMSPLCSTIINSNSSTSNVNNNSNNNNIGGICVVSPLSQSIQTDNSITTTMLGANNSLLNSSVSSADANNKSMSGSSSSSSDVLMLNDAISNKAEDSDAASEPKKRRIDSCNDDAELSRDLKDKLHACFVCKTEMCPRTRPLERGRGPQYGIPDDAIPIGARVCNTCQCKSVRSRYSSCPLPTCPNPKDRVKRFRNLPPRLFELAAEIRDPIIQEFQIPPNVTKCCSACLIRIRRKMGPHVPGTNLTEDEVIKLKNVLQEIGPKWSQLGEIMGKTTVVLKTFYYHYKKKYALDTAVSEYYKMHPSEERRSTMTDGDESDLSTSSGDEREGNSDTASAESPKNNLVINSTQSATSITNVTGSVLKDNNVAIESIKNDDRLAPPLGHAPRKSSSSSKQQQQQQDEYDSSATETADEENESSPANRQSPKVSVYSNQATITMVPTGGSISSQNQQSAQPQFQNGPINNNPSNVRDLFLNVIERTIKSNGPTHKQPMQIIKNQSGQPQVQTQQQQQQQQQNDNRNDITFVREYRNDGKINLSRSTPTQNTDSLATLSVVDAHGHTTQIQPSLQGIPSQIAATITPVPPQQSHNVQSMPPQTQPQMHEGIKEQVGNPGSGIVVYVRNNEPEDLSIKKTSRDTFPPPQSKQQSMPPTQQQQQQQQQPHGCVTMYRNDPPQPQPQPNNIPPNQFMGSSYQHHHDINRSSKSPSMFVSSSPISITQQQQQQHQQQNRSIPHQQTPPPSSNMQQSQNKLSVSSKLTPKLSPKINQNPKGSITHGTPVNTTPIQGMQGPTTLSPRFDGIRRQTPPSNDNSNKMMPGSITQGTPVLLSGHQHHIADKRAYEYFKNSRQSPQTQHQQQTQQNSQQQPQPQFGAQYPRSGSIVSGFGGAEQSRQILLNDFITSQHMMGQQRGGTGRSVDKDSPSPRSGSNLSNSPATLYYSDKERGRQDYLSRTSPAEHINSVPSPHRTPPPQRQGVIQRHNTGSSKPPSPLPNRMHVMSQQQQPQVQQPPPQSHLFPGPGRIHYGGYKNMSQSSAEQYPLSGHEAFSSLVDVAVKQPLLPVPNKDEIKREQHPSQQPPPQPHHDMRYQPISRDHHIAMQIAAQQHQQQQQHQHQQQQQQQLRHQQHQIDMRRQQQQQSTLYQIEREREQREQFRERERQVQAQAQIERDRAEREREQRERHERNMIDRERERIMIIEEKEREDRRRDARMHQVNVVPHIIRGGAPPNMGNRSGLMDRERERGDNRQTQDSCITTGSLIDAIIAHSINSTSEHPPSRGGGGGPVGNVAVGPDPLRNSFFAGRQDHAHVVSENNGKSHSPNVINIDLESDSPQTARSSGNVITKSIKLGELADSIIAKDFSQNPLSFRPSFMSYPETIAPTEQWKYRRHMVAKEEIQNKNLVERLTPEVAFEQQMNVHHEPISPPDKRQIIRIQPPSPNIQGMVFPEPVSPPAKRQIIRIQPQSPLATSGMTFSEIIPSPEDHFQSSSDRRSVPMQQSSSSVPPVSEFQLDRYMSSKIVEAMRTSDEKMRQDDGTNCGPDRSQQQNPGRNTPGEGGDKRMLGNNDQQQSNQPPQQQYSQPQPLTTFAQSTYAYPFSALNVGATPAASLAAAAAAAAAQSNQQQSKMSNSDGGDNQSRQQQQLAEPKPLLSAQYEALSDEDD